MYSQQPDYWLLIASLIGLFYVCVLGIMLLIISDDERLDISQKWGFALGMIGALPLFLPLYLIIVPTKRD